MENNNLILNAETCDNILQMLKSNDKSNLTVVEETIRNIDVGANLPYLLIMFKESSVENRKTVFLNIIKEQLNAKCIHLKLSDNPKDLTYNRLYTEVKAHENIKPEAMEYFLERFASSLGSVMVSWGFAFMEDFDLKLIPKK
jgi:hypothetical protein